MATLSRDDFSKPTKRILAARAGHVCSFPDCPQHTSGPSAEANDASVNLGEACHIRAAASGPGARRHDPSMSAAERRSIDNGIWMCRTHAKLIDSDEARYTVEQLHRWKSEAEARAEGRLRSGSAAAMAASGLYGTPRTPSLRFVGRRAELSQLRQLLRSSEAVRIAASVEGLPGIGKTELALQLVYQLARDGAFPGGIFWFNAEDPDLLPAWGGAMADALGVAQGPLEERTTQVLRSVSRQRAPTLLVLDNVEAWSAERRPSPLPEGTHLRYLITTRQRRLGGAGFEHVSVGFLDPDFARQLLEAVSGRELAAAPGFDDLVQHLGGHALAVELAGAFLDLYPQETPASYLAELRAGGEVETEVSELVRYNRTVAQAFQTLWDRLDEATRVAWRLAACFEPEPVTAELSDAVGLIARSRRRLQRLHLIEVDGEARWWMHRLTREFGRRAGKEAELAAGREAFVNGCADFAEQIESSDGYRQYLPNRLHLDAAVWMAPAVLDAKDPVTTELPKRVAVARYSAGDLNGAKRLAERALASHLQSFGEEHAGVATHRTTLGVVLRALGDLEGARELHEQALAAGLKNLGGEHPDVATRRSNLAAVLRDLGDFEGAKELLEQALAAGFEKLGEEHPEVATRRSNLAVVLQDLGDLEGARKLLEQSLATGLEKLGEEHPTVAIWRSNLAVVLRQLGDLEGARELLAQALAAGLKSLGEEHPQVAIRRSILALLLRDLGNLEGARELLEQALASGLKNLGEEHPEVAVWRSNLALVLQDLGDLDGAKAMAQKALEAVARRPEGSHVRVNAERVAEGILGDRGDPVLGR